MTPTEPLGRSSSALRIVVAAERLFALHGIDGVSLRQIAAEAGSGNNSAVHYHFGSKEALVEAIFRHRLPQLNGERRLLASRCDPDDLRSRFEAYYLPLFAMAEDTGNYYVSFVEQLQRQQVARSEVGSGLREVPDEERSAHAGFVADVERLLPHLADPARRLRIAQAEMLCVHAAADRERAVIGGAKVGPYDGFVGTLLDGVHGFLMAASTTPAAAAPLRKRSAPEPKVGTARTR